MLMFKWIFGLKCELIGMEWMKYMYTIECTIYACKDWSADVYATCTLNVITVSLISIAW